MITLCKEKLDALIENCQTYGYSIGMQHGCKPDIFKSVAPGKVIRIGTDKDSGLYGEVLLWIDNDYPLSRNEYVLPYISDLIRDRYVDERDVS